MNRETGNVLLVLLGGALLKIAYNGSYLRYVKPSLLPFLVVAGAVIALLGAVTIVRDLRERRRGRHLAAARGFRGTHEHETHEHGTGSAWLLLLPVLAILLVAPPALGADQVIRSTAVSAPMQGIRFGPLPADEEAPELPIWEFVARAVWDEKGRLDGRDVRLTGFAVRAPDGSVQLARLRISCCAADASAGRVKLHGNGTLAGQVAQLEQDGWYQARGRLQPGSGGPHDEFVPTLDVGQIRPVPAPTEPYESG